MNANWRTTLWGTLSAVSAGILGLCVSLSQAAISTKPGDVDPLLNYILYSVPSKWRAYITLGAALVTAVAGQRFATNAKSKNVTGGTVQQTVSGAVADTGTQALVDQTVKASIASGDTEVTAEQKAAVAKDSPKVVNVEV